MGYGDFMAKPIDQVAVLGAGVMGASIAAHLANAGIKVLLLDIPPKDAPAGNRRARNQITAAGLERARKAKPAAFVSPRFESAGDGGEPGGRSGQRPPAATWSSRRSSRT